MSLKGDSKIAKSKYIEVENGIFKCSICDKDYRQKASLIKHMEKNHDLQDHESLICSVCCKSFESIQRLTRHQKESKCKNKSLL